MRGLGVDPESLRSGAETMASSADGEPSPVGHIASAASPGRRPRRVHYARSGPEIDRLLADSDALLRALRRYGRHDDDCNADQTCSCGLDRLLTELDPPTEP